MTAAGDTGDGGGVPPFGPVPDGGLPGVLGGAPLVLDSGGRIVFWGPGAEELFGRSAREALGRPAVPLLAPEGGTEAVAELFAETLRTGRSRTGSFPVRHGDGGTRPVEFRVTRLLDERGAAYALALAADRSALRRLEREVALSAQVIRQAPNGLAVLDTSLRYVSVNPALERINGLPAAEHLGRTVREVLPGLETVDLLEAAARRVLAVGRPVVDQAVRGRTPAGPDEEHVWSLSLYRLEAPDGTVLGVVISVEDITERHRAEAEAEAARRRLAAVAEASSRIGTTLDLERTAHELASVAVPGLADIAAVDLLEPVTRGRRSALRPADPAVIRALAVAAEDAGDALRAADPPGEVARYGPDRLVTECVRAGRPVLVSRVTDADLPRIARSPEAAGLLGRAGVHSYLAVPLIARGEVLGALDLKRIGNPLPFGEDDLLLARELASRAALQIDNARWYQNAREAALTLQRSLLPAHPPVTGGLEVASRYRPAEATNEVGGDWFDVIPLDGGRTALVVGDVMGSGIAAAASMGRLRTATDTLAVLGLDPALLLEHLDRTAAGLDQAIATCVYAVHDPHTRTCRIASAGHPPPVRLRAGREPELLDLPTGVPLGVGGVAFSAVTVDLEPGDRLVLYTDGLVETRRHSLDERLGTLLSLLGGPDRPLEELCDLLLDALREPHTADDVALLIARATPPSVGGPPAAPGHR
ncbi:MULTISPECIES: SpoIIE family protein phosphatase [unclassified Streptomyces]|uniref:SpoIIE family protein phosphatase n=1 Tax=unclassified Streptomyces TaxID=2593676 RepID=UPI002237954D|nr:SpoIIE family protein phosphatase [Streptomyces sp. SHP 1-2]MCW5252098.1 SpoIIE family protein phosphatase [Streptomyces sp. SHP 1-2]